MRFLVDECAGPAVAQWLRDRGYEVFSIYDQQQGMTDDDVLAKAYEENWVLLTNDKDFGEMIFRRQAGHRGVIFMRLADERSAKKIDVLANLLDNHRERIGEHFVTVTENKVRFG